MSACMQESRAFRSMVRCVRANRYERSSADLGRRVPKWVRSVNWNPRSGAPKQKIKKSPNYSLKSKRLSFMFVGFGNGADVHPIKRVQFGIFSAEQVVSVISQCACMVCAAACLCGTRLLAVVGLCFCMDSGPCLCWRFKLLALA
jgi:hypothetical protein